VAFAPSPAVSREEVREYPETSSPWRVQLGGGALFALGRTPMFSPGLAVSATIRKSLFSFMLDGRLLLPMLATEIQSRSGQTISLRATMYTASMGPCLHANRLFFCVPFEIGLRDFSVSSGAAVMTNERVLTMLGVRVGFEQPISHHLSFRGYVEATGTGKHANVLADGREVWNAPRLTGVLSASLIYLP